MSVTVSTTLDLDDLIQMLYSDLTRDEMFLHITQLDNMMQDAEFTQRLYVHFRDVLKSEDLLLTPQQAVDMMSSVFEDVKLPILPQPFADPGSDPEPKP